MPIRAIYFDVETTGLDCKINDIIHLAMIFELDGVIKEQCEFRICPINVNSISSEAMAVTGLTVEEIMKYPSQEEVFPGIVAALDRHINKFDRKEKAYPIGWNARFDIGFLVELWRRNNSTYLGSYFNWRDIDLLYLMYVYDFLGYHRLPNYKLPTVAKYYGIKHVEHDAMSDALASREIAHKFLWPFIKKEAHEKNEPF